MPGCERPARDPSNPASLCDTCAGEGEDTDPDGATPGVETDDPGRTTTDDGRTDAKGDEDAGNGGSAWGSARFADPEAGVYPPAWGEREQWMCHTPGDKKPFAPWADRDHPEADPEDDARWMWGITDNYADLDTAREWADKHPRVGGVTYLLRELGAEPFAFVDGDDVRDPDTGEVHPEFVAVLERLGLTYADVSTSGTGVHAVYRGDLPDGVKQATFELDDEPWGANDDAPAVEIYDHKHVCVTTGEHVPGTPVEVREWDDDALASVLDDQGLLPEDDPDDVSTDRDDYDLDDYDPQATGADETTDDIRDLFAALDRIDARRVAEKTIVHRWNDGATTSGDNRAFAPNWGPNANGTANIVDDRLWQDTGGNGYGGPVVMAHLHRTGQHRGTDPTVTPADVTGEDWFAAVDHLRDLGFSIPRLERSSGDGEPTDRELSAEDLLDAGTTLDRREAWRAATTVGPDHLDGSLGLDHDGDGWECPACGETVADAVRGAALAEGAIDCCRDDVDDPATYDRLYDALRDDYDAPLPEYVPPTRTVEDMDRAEAAVGALRGWHILDDLDSEVTVETPRGEDAVAVLDPTWEDSESGERVVLFQSGLFYCREHNQAVWPLQVVALEQGIITTESEWLQGDDWLRAYALARTEYGAPLPPIVWNDAEDAPEALHLPVLPESEDLLGEGITTDESRLDAARDDVADLYGRIADGDSSNHLLTVLPALGKSYNAVTQADEYPTLYTAKRKELRKEAAERAADHGVGWMHLPTLGESRPPERVLQAAAAHVRESGRSALRDREALLEAVESTYHAIDEPWPAYEREHVDSAHDDRCPAGAADEDDEVHLDRAACGCGDGGHGPEWQLAFWTARKLGDKPRDLHVRGETIFGEEPPCARDDECPYTRAWERATDPDAPVDLLIGHPVHAYVGGARSQPRRTENDSLYAEDRVVALDEFPGDVYTREFGEEFVQHARWLASCLDDGVDDTTDLFDRRADLWSDEFVRDWLNGEASPPILDAIQAKREQAEDDDAEAPDWSALRDADLGVDGDLAALVGRAIDAAADPDRDAEELLESAVTALRGGRSGAEVLASGAEDGYAHPDAYWLLLAVLAPAGFDGDDLDAEDDWRAGVTAEVRETEHFDLGSDNGRVKAVAVADRFRILVDRDVNGAVLLTPPDLARNTVVALDATGRTELWELAVGAEFDTRDVHDTGEERRAFLRDVLNLKVVQTTPHVHTYSGSPASKNFGDDVALVDAVADEFGRQQLAQDRLTGTSAPAVVTTKTVEEYVGADLHEAGAGTVEHYGDLIGSNRLDEYNVGVILGAQHYGHDTAEKWALLAGEEFGVSGRGTDLDYGSATANALLARMREDKVMQSILRFGRDEEGAVVFAHTAALREDLPVVDHGDMVEAWSANQKAVARAAADRRGEAFTVADILADDRVDCHRRTVRRLLNEFADLGYLHRDGGHTNDYELIEDPGTGGAELPDGIGPSVDREAGPTATDRGQADVENTNTWFVWSSEASGGGSIAPPDEPARLGPPRGASTAGPPD